MSQPSTWSFTLQRLVVSNKWSQNKCKTIPTGQTKGQIYLKNFKRKTNMRNSNKRQPVKLHPPVSRQVLYSVCIIIDTP